MSPNRQKPLAGAYRNAVFNTARRTSHQISVLAASNGARLCADGVGY